MRRAAAVLAIMLALALLVAPTIAATAVADEHDQGDEIEGDDVDELEQAENESDAENETDGYTIDELRTGGTEIPGADPSSRWIDGGLVFVEYSDANPLLAGSGEDWQVDQVLGNGDRVEVDELTVHAERGQGADPSDYELEVVYWNEGETERTVVENGEERTETVPVAENVTTETTALEFGGSFDRQDVSLSRSDDPRQVTMWLVDAETGDRVDGAAWTFEHDSIATSASAGISTMGDLLWWSFWWIVVPTLILLAIVGTTVPRLIRAAGNASPNIDWPLWIIAIGTIGFFTIVLAYHYLASLIVALPLVFPIVVSLVVAALLLETYDDNVRSWAFMSMLTSDTTGPTGEDAKDAVSGTLRRKRITKTDGSVAIPGTGLRAFIARIWVGPTVLEGANEIKGALPLMGSGPEKLVFLADSGGASLKHRPETLKLKKPNFKDPLVIGVGAIVSISTLAVAQMIWSSWMVGLSLLAPLLLIGCYRPVPGRAIVEPAPSQAKSAYATALYLEAELQKYETVEDLAEALISEKNRSEEIREMLEDLEDSTIIKQSHNREEGSLFSDGLTRADDEKEETETEAPADD